MEYRSLGKSGLQLSELSLGSWLTFGKQIEKNTAEDLMKIAYDNGVNFFDNAEIYARGESEKVMGKILNKMKWDRDSYCVSSKVFFDCRGTDNTRPNQNGLSRKHIFEACHQAINRLKVDYLDLYFCHRPDKNTPVEETVWAMHNLITQGKILYWGTSEWSAQEIMEAHMVAKQHHLVGPTMEQPQYNMLHREKVEIEFSQIYKTVGLGTTIWSPLASGVLTGKYNGNKNPKDTRLNMDGMDWLKKSVLDKENIKQSEKLVGLSKDLNLSLPVLAIAWCLKNENVSTVILGASKTSQLKENFKAIDAKSKLTPEVMTKIDQLLNNVPIRPNY